MIAIVKRANRCKLIYGIVQNIFLIITLAALYLITKNVLCMGILITFSLLLGFIWVRILFKKRRINDNEDRNDIELIDKEMAEPNQKFSGGRLNATLGPERALITITKSYLIAISRSEVLIVKLADIIWIYSKKYVTTHGSGYILTIVDNRTLSHDIWFHVPTHNILEQIKSVLQTRVPWAMVGYSKSIFAIWNKDKEVFIRQVANRQQEYNHSREN